MTSEEGMRAHLDLQGGRPSGVMLPIHWATFNLAPHPWAELGEGTVSAAAVAGASAALPRPGEPFEPTGGSVPAEPWWRGVSVAPAGGWPTMTGLPHAVAELEGETEVRNSARAADTPGDMSGGRGADSGDPETVRAN
jgi:hypothetical protein